MSVCSGYFKDHDLLHEITDFVVNYYTVNQTKTNHLWINDISNDILTKIDNVRTSNDIIKTIQNRFPGSKIKPVTEVDEVYYAVSPKDASGSDRALVDCHYDAPFYWISGVIFYRIIIACNENDAVQTSFPNDNITVKMNIGDFHGLDYNKDYHCVDGKIPPGKHRILLKLHYLVTPKDYENTFLESLVKFLNVKWIYTSRWIMNKSAKPSTFIEHCIALIVTGFMFIYNNFILFLIALLIFIIYKRSNFSD